MSPSRRPITAEEQPHLDAMGAKLRAIRLAAGVSMTELAPLAQLSAAHIGAIERAQRRTRRSTLERLLRPLVPAEQLDRTVDELVGLAGPALAPESTFADRVQRRRERRWRNRGGAEADLADKARTARDLRRTARRIERHRRGTPSAKLLKAMAEHLEAGDVGSSPGTQRPLLHPADRRQPCSAPRRPRLASSWSSCRSNGSCAATSTTPRRRAVESHLARLRRFVETGEDRG